MKMINTRIFLVITASIVIGMLAMALYGTSQQRKNIRTENERTLRRLVGTVNEGFSTIMLEADADIAQQFADSLKTVSEIRDYRILRVDGLEAFRDNKTILTVNRKIGDEEFSPRDDEEEIRIVARENFMFNRAIADKAMMSFYSNDTEGLPTLTLFSPMINRKECHKCHGSDHEVRGVIKVTTSLRDVEKDIEKSWNGALYMMVALNILILSLIIFMVNRISNPLKNVSTQLGSINEIAYKLSQIQDIKSSELLRKELKTVSASLLEISAKIKKIFKL